MNQRRLLGAVIVLFGLLSTAGMFYAGHADATASAQGYAVTHDISAGTVLGSSDVAEVAVGTGGGDSFGFLETSPVGWQAEHAIPVHSLLHAGDVTQQTGLIPIPGLKLSGATGSGVVDIFATRSGQATLEGHGMQLVAGTLEVPARDETRWAVLAMAEVPLYAVAVPAGGPPVPGVEAAADDALDQLARSAADGSAGDGAAPTGTPVQVSGK